MDDPKINTLLKLNKIKIEKTKAKARVILQIIVNFAFSKKLVKSLVFGVNRFKISFLFYQNINYKISNK